MPNINSDRQQEQVLITKAAICGNQELRRISDQQLADSLNICVKTFRYKKKKPDSFRLSELHTMAELLKFTPIQAAGILLGRDLTDAEKHRTSGFLYSEPFKKSLAYIKNLDEAHFKQLKRLEDVCGMLNESGLEKAAEYAEMLAGIEKYQEK